MNSVVTPYTPLLLLLYIVGLAVAIFSFTSLTKHLYKNFKKSAVSAFMLSIWSFFFFFGAQVTSSIMSRIIDIFGLQNTTWDAIRWLMWTISQIGTTISFLAIGLLVYHKRFDLYITQFSKDDLKEG